MIEAINATIDFRTSAFETTAVEALISVDPVTAAWLVVVVRAVEKAYEPSVLPAENVQTLRPPFFRVVVAAHAVPTDGIFTVFVMIAKPVIGVPVAIKLPYASLAVMVRLAIAPGAYTALSQAAVKLAAAPLETVAVTI